MPDKPDKTYENGHQDAQIEGLRSDMQGLSGDIRELRDDLKEVVQKPDCEHRHNILWVAVVGTYTFCAGLALACWQSIESVWAAIKGSQ